MSSESLHDATDAHSPVTIHGYIAHACTRTSRCNEFPPRFGCSRPACITENTPSPMALGRGPGEAANGTFCGLLHLFQGLMPVCQLQSITHKRLQQQYQ